MGNTSNYSSKAFAWRCLPLLILLLLLILFYSLGYHRYLNFETLKDNRSVLLAWTSSHYFTVIFVFFICYTLVVAISIPGAVFLTLAGGFLFGIVPGTVVVVISATVGATLLFLAVSNASSEWLRKKASNKVNLMREGFQKNAWTYLLILRLIPLFPFWLVNIASAILGVPFRTFVIATFLGIIPGAFVYITIGNGLGKLFDSDKTPDLSIIFFLPILLPLIGLALLSCLPWLYHRFRKKRS